MTIAASHPLAFQVGARKLASIRRRLVRVPLSLEQALAGAPPPLPRLPEDADGYAITSLPAAHAASLGRDTGGMLAFERQHYTRYFADLTIGHDAWWAGLSANARSQMKRKEKRLAGKDGALAIRRFGPGDDFAAFHRDARAIALGTYQEKLLGAGLPGDAGFVADMLRAGAEGRIRAWLLAIDGAPAAYLYCPVERGTVIYAYVGHDPAHNALSPGAVLHLAAMRDLFAEGGLKRFDFTEGEGQHKRQLSSGGVECVDLLLLRPTLANRATIAALHGFDRAVALAKRAAGHGPLSGIAQRLRRG